MTRTCKLVIMGSGGVGRSSLTTQFVHGVFVERYDPTIETTFRVQVEINSKVYFLEILVTAGNGTEQCTAIKDYYMRNGEAFMLVYSITARSTFQDIKELREEILKVKKLDSSKVPLILVGNKLDLKDQRVISSEEGERLAREFGCKFLETSAKTSENVTEAFEALIERLDEVAPVSSSDSEKCIIS